MTNWRTRLASAALLIVGFALALRLADDLLAPLFTTLVVLGCLCAIFLLCQRRR